MTELLNLSLQAMAILLAADLASGLTHWAQDRFAWSRLALINRLVILYADEHHREPNRLLQYSWLQRNGLAGVGSLLAAALFAMGVLPWQVTLFAVLYLFSGELHYWSHRPAADNGWLIGALQRAHLIQDARHHARHHAAGDDNYCVMTPFVNPVLNRLRVFQRLDRMVPRVAA